MTDEELAQITAAMQQFGDAWAAYAQRLGEAFERMYEAAVAAGLIDPNAETEPESQQDELERLRRENAAMREIVQAIAGGRAAWDMGYAGMRCCFCDTFMGPTMDEDTRDPEPHTGTCLVTKSRELLQHPPNSSHNV